MNNITSYRAKVEGDKEWSYGMIITLSTRDNGDGEVIYGMIKNYQPLSYCLRARPETICRKVGLEDSVGNDIYEGDIVAVPCSREGKEYIGVVEFGEIPNGDDRYMGFHIKWNNPNIVGSVRCSLLWWRDTKDRYLKVIGNKWDNPELLEGDNGDKKE